MRALRRHHKQRMRKKAELFFKISMAHTPNFNLLPLIVKHADNLKMCSCWCCGNPRRYFKGDDKLRIQEKRMQSAKE